MVKAVGFLIICVCGWIIGSSFSTKLTSRVRELAKMIDALNLFETEVVFALNPIVVAFIRIGELVGGHVGDVFLKTAQLIDQREGLTAQQAWIKAAEQQKGKMNLRADDWQVVSMFGTLLGTTDRDSQLKSTLYSKTLLIEHCRQAESERDKYAKLYKSAGVLCGVLLAMLLT